MINIIIYISFGVIIGLIAYKVLWGDKFGLLTAQSQKKIENKQKILDFLVDNKKITNNNAEKLLNVSNNTAERYLDELEKEGKLKQIGITGKSVYYIKR